MKKSLSIEEFLETRPDITPEMLEEGRLLVEAKIKGYEQPEAHLRPGERQHRRHAGGDAAALHHQPGRHPRDHGQTSRCLVRASGSGYRSSALQARGVRLGGGLTEGIVSTSDGASRFRCAAGRRWYGNAARCGFIVIRYLFVVFIQHVGIIKTATNEPLIEMVRYLGRRGEYPRRTRKASCRTRSRFSRGSAG